MSTPADLLDEVAEIVYDFIHKAQVTHKRPYKEIPEDWKRDYRDVARQVIEKVAGAGK